MKLLTDVLNIDVPAKLEEKKKELEVKKEPSPLAIQDKEIDAIDADFTKIRSDILSALETAKGAVENMHVIAKDKEDSKSFEALNGLLNTVVNTGTQLINLYSRKQEFKDKRMKALGMKDGQQDKPAGDINIDKAVFVGTPNELKEYIRKLREESE